MQSVNPKMPSPRVLASLTRVGQRQGLDPLLDRLATLRKWLGEDLVALEEALSLVFQAETPTVAILSAQHLLASPGKRLRPLCVLLSARLGPTFGREEARDAAVACELVHAATLLHDDVMDEGAERRGRPTARMVYGNSASVLGGDHLLLDALTRIHHLNRPELMKTLLGVVSQMVAAEAVQLEQRGNLEPSRQVYLNVVHGKTASLFRWGLTAGGTLAGLDAPATESLGHCGEALGVSFQLVDDLLDLRLDSAIIGKTVLADMREGKMTWPLILAAERDPHVLARLQGMITAAEEPSADAIQELLERIAETGALTDTHRFAKTEANRGLEQLRTLPLTPARQLLEQVVAATVERLQ